MSRFVESYLEEYSETARFAEQFPNGPRPEGAKPMPKKGLISDAKAMVQHGVKRAMGGTRDAITGGNASSRGNWSGYMPKGAGAGGAASKDKSLINSAKKDLDKAQGLANKAKAYGKGADAAAGARQGTLAARDGIKGAVDATKGKIANAGAHAAGKVGDVLNKAGDAAHSMGDAIRPHMNDAKAIGRMGASKIGAAASGISQKAQGGLNKIGSAPGKISNAVGSAARGALNAVDNSPLAHKAAGMAGSAVGSGINFALDHPKMAKAGAAGAVGMGVLGAAGLAYKALASLKKNGNMDPTDDDLHDEMKRHKAKDDEMENGGDLNKDAQGMGGSSPGPGYKMTFGHWRKVK